ncbi:hypothetical protein ACFU44_19210 [Nocardia rhizosphaerihabitans]|uniref:hypothetical protein n=1 Tax=Nocardia rhizosphaerihabitans TaxID=1691570 RepID=UPI00366F93B3
MGALGIVAIGGAFVAGSVSGLWWKALGAPVGAVTAAFYTFLLVTPMAVAVAVAFSTRLPFSATIHRGPSRTRGTSIWITCALITLLTAIVLWCVTAFVTLLLSLRTASWAGGVSVAVAEHYLWQIFDPSTIAWSAAQTLTVAMLVVFVPLTVEHLREPTEHAVTRRRVRISATAVLVIFGVAYTAIAVYQARVVPIYVGLN